ncbi:MAG: hypothetical protein M5T61_21630 [Acidimicrobiia bacterium]|nr:hypothetical protein [Acidimicrobiia bacterium]
MTERDLAAETVAVLSTGEHTMLANARHGVRARNTGRHRPRPRPRGRWAHLPGGRLQTAGSSTG